MTKQIKVTQTKMQKVYYSEKEGTVYKGGYKQVPVAEGKLILLEPTRESLLTRKICEIVPKRPIIISEIEKIEDGDWCYDLGTKEVYQAVKGIRFTKSVKILALPEHFSPKHLQAIVDGKLKDGDKVLVECFKHSYDSFNKLFISNGDLAEQTNIHTSIKLNSDNYITLHKIEEKLYTREEVRDLLEKLVTDSSPSTDEDSLIYYNSYNDGDGHFDTDGYYLGKEFKEWFENNVK